jgi:hypothetical protein
MCNRNSDMLSTDLVQYIVRVSFVLSRVLVTTDAVWIGWFLLNLHIMVSSHFPLSVPRFVLYQHKLTLFLVSWSGMRMSSLGASAINWPVVPAPDDRWIWSISWNENWQRKQKHLEETCPSATVVTINPTWRPEIELGSSLWEAGD